MELNLLSSVWKQKNGVHGEREACHIWVGWEKNVVLKPSDLTELIGNQLKSWNPHPGGCHIGQIKETYVTIKGNLRAHKFPLIVQYDG